MQENEYPVPDKETAPSPHPAPGGESRFTANTQSPPEKADSVTGGNNPAPESSSALPGDFGADTVPAVSDTPGVAPFACTPSGTEGSRETVRRSAKKAANCFGSSKTPAPLVTGLLLLLLLAVGAWLLYELAAVLFSAAGAPLACYTVSLVLAVLLFLWFGMPVAFGRMRLSGLLLKGEQVSAGGLLHYYCPQLLCRSFLLSLIHLATLLAPFAFAVGGIVLSRLFYLSVLLSSLGFGVATLIFLGLVVLSLVLGAVIFLISGLFYFTAGYAVGNEQLPLRAAVRASVRTGARNMRTIAVFRTQNIVYIFLSLLTVGVLYVLYFGHRIQLTYLDLCETLKGDSE